ncbi:MAG: phenylalanine--tRNA ligase subunit beta [Azoarcus sp.]|jgi:phenylalanyl-tRNA synthetase beta chain|nr:phenylalanine--tRNA ligase subunit beta [Azoarcus sp.]
MQFSENWLRTFVNPPLDSGAFGHLMTMAGLEVEEAHPVAPPFSGVVVARIIEAGKHPNADKLKLCKVDAGTGEPLQIVCGAPNAAAGMKVPCAKIGAELPGGFAIKAARLRGVESFGMLCSAHELGLSEDHDGLLALEEDAPVGMDIRDWLALNDTCFVIKLTPNRADCLSLAGVAREVAALTGASFIPAPLSLVPPANDARRGIVLDAPKKCPRYCGRVISGVNAKAPSPAWMKDRLKRSGLRPIHALVDITNYVMLELGQPLHVFDNACLSGAIHVRLPHPGEELRLLNEQNVTPTPDTLLIADEARALALAGIMGGEETGVTLDTTEVFLESAFFTPEAIAGRGRAYGLTSDASHRFERGVDFQLQRPAIERATQLILDICGGVPGPVEETCADEHLPLREEVALRPARVRQVLGIDLEHEDMRKLLERVYLTVRDLAVELRVTPPAFRFDIETEEDLIEEIARLHGYDNIPSLAPRGNLAMLASTESARTQWDVCHFLAGRGFQEVVNFSFVDSVWERDFCANNAPIRLANPIASQMDAMRSSLIPGLVSDLATNRKRQQNRVRVFELGRCFTRREQGAGETGEEVPGFHQPRRLAALAAGTAFPEQWGESARATDFFDLKGDLEALFAPRGLTFAPVSVPALHPGRAASVFLDGHNIGVIGELHPAWTQRFELGAAPVVFEVDLDATLSALCPSNREISRMPTVLRDLALLVPANVPAERVLNALREAAPATVREILLFDVYQGKGIESGCKSLAFRISMQDTQHTLEDAEVDQAISGLLRHVERTVGGRLRV